MGCPECANVANADHLCIDENEFLSRFIDKFDQKFDTDIIAYRGYSTPITFACPEHGAFQTTPQNILASTHGCPQCAITQTTKFKKLTESSFRNKAREIHGDRYTYEWSDVSSNKSKIKITCQFHGSFLQTISDHLSGKGCITCGHQKTSDEKISKAASVFKEKATAIHDGYYTYDSVDYQKSNTKVEINCPLHGTFFQSPNVHLSGKGCPKCTNVVSNPELEICAFLKENNITHETSVKSILKNPETNRPLELDIFVPDSMVGIEFCGLYWHSDARSRSGCKQFAKHRHKTKYDLCSALGIRLITIFEDEWRLNSKMVKNSLIQLLNPIQRSNPNTYTIKPVSPDHAKKFSQKYDTKPFRQTDCYIGAYIDSQLMGVIGFHNTQDTCSITNFSTSTNITTLLQIIEHYTKSNNIEHIYVSTDNRWFDDLMIAGIGFHFISETEIDYQYTDTKRRYPRDDNDYHTLHKIWNCGAKKWKWSK